MHEHLYRFSPFDPISRISLFSNGDGQCLLIGVFFVLRVSFVVFLGPIDSSRDWLAHLNAKKKNHTWQRISPSLQTMFVSIFFSLHYQCVIDWLCLKWVYLKHSQSKTPNPLLWSGTRRQGFVVLFFCLHLMPFLWPGAYVRAGLHICIRARACARACVHVLALENSFLSTYRPTSMI